MVALASWGNCPALQLVVPAGVMLGRLRSDIDRRRGGYRGAIFVTRENPYRGHRCQGPAPIKTDQRERRLPRFSLLLVGTCLISLPEIAGTATYRSVAQRCTRSTRSVGDFLYSRVGRARTHYLSGAHRAARLI